MGRGGDLYVVKTKSCALGWNLTSILRSSSLVYLELGPVYKRCSGVGLS